MSKQAPQTTTDTPHKGPGTPRNLRPNPKGLKRGGLPVRTILTIPELEFANWLAQGASVSDAARWANILTGDIYYLARMPRIRAERDRLIKKHTAEAEDRVSALRDKLGTFVVGEFQHRTRTAQTHQLRGDQDIRNLLRDGMEAVGLVQPKGTVINASAQAGAATFQPLYQPAKVQQVREVGRQMLEANVESKASVIQGTGELGA